MVKKEITACIFHVAFSWDRIDKRLTYYWQDTRNAHTGLFLIIQQPLKTLRRKTQSAQLKTPSDLHQYWSLYFQQGFFFNSVLHDIKKMLTFHRRDLGQAVHCCNLLAMVVSGELHVTDGGI